MYTHHTHITDESSYRLIAEIGCFGHYTPNYTDAEANARIIAAAPELLRTLQQLYNSFQHTEGNDKGNQAKTDVILYNEDVKAALNATMKLLSKIK